MAGPLDTLKTVFNPVARVVTAPYRAMRFVMDVQKANVGWDVEIKPPKLSPERKKELLEATSLDTPRSTSRAVMSILKPYWTQSGKKEIATATFLLGATLALSKLTVDQQVNFQFLNRELGDIIQTIFSNVQHIRPGMVDNMIKNYPDLQHVLAANPVLDKMMHLYPDTTSFQRDPEILAFLKSQGPEGARNWVEFLREAPTMPDILMKFPGMADKIKDNPDILTQMGQIQTQIGSQLYASNGESITRFLQLCFTDFFTNWGKTAHTFLGDPFNTWAGMKATFNSSALNALNTTLYDVDKVQNLLTHPLDTTWNWLTSFGSRPLSAAGEVVPGLVKHPLQAMGSWFGMLSTPFSEAAKESASQSFASNDFGNLVTKFMVLALAQYKAAQTLILRWRAWTTGYFANKWTSFGAYNQLKNKFNNIDNPDQRLQDDPYRFTTGAVSVLTGLVSTAFRFTAFAGVLWGLANWNLAYFGGPDQVLPGTMFWIGFSYAASLTGLTWAAGRKLPEISRNQQMREGNFRSALKKVHDNANEVAINGSEDVEKEIMKNQYAPVLNNQVREINTSIKIQLVDSVFGNLSIPVPLFAGAFSIATGTMSMGTISLLNSSFGAVTSSLSFIVNRWDQLSAMKAVSDRLSSFDKTVELAHYEAEERRQAGLATAPTPGGPS